ncbi:DinB family protein [Jeotgalibacillus aurantiacus]|uniref:DinB family protein n=1 Tax=Jeotgalibacillus aurantiacus TaxID=2763266 RepID=UPI001D09E88D|nr:DinB family protein [Jeotgalibacillus aurantiacus]
MHYQVKNNGDYSEKIGELVSMLDITRDGTLKDLEGLSVEDLDFLTDESANSIGMLLAHMAAIEFVHQLITFENRDFSEEEWKVWGAAISLGEKGRSEIKGFPLSYYLQKLKEVREYTLSQLKTKTDEWLYTEGLWPNGVKVNHYYFWYHVMEDEIGHRGQIRLIKKQLRSKSKI